MKKLFNLPFDKFVEKTKFEIYSKINLLDYNLILNMKNEFIESIIKEYEVEKIEVDFNEITYSKKTKDVWDSEGNPEKLTIYTYKIPFKGDESLLNYFSNKGRSCVSPYCIEGDMIIFKSVNDDLKYNVLNINNKIEILKNMIHNLNKDYAEYNESLKENVEFYFKCREKNLIECKEFCNKYKLSEEEIGKMEFKLSAIEALSKIIAGKYTGSEITILFKKAGFPEIVHDGSTKWKFVCEIFEKMQNESIEGFYKILKVLEVVCDPQEYLLNPKEYNEILENVNRVLSFYNLKFDEEGVLNQLIVSNRKLKPSNKNSIQNEEKYDVFISHSSTDKDWVNNLYECLSKKDLKIWYDAKIIKIGDNIRKKINEGLNKSDYGIIVISDEFIQRSWTNIEFDGLIHLMDDGKLLPIVHGVDTEKLEQFFKPLLNIHYLSTESHDLRQICDEIYLKIRGTNI